MTNREAYVAGNDDDDVEWAFAGHASSSPAKDGRPAHTIWAHWIDSKSDLLVSDEGDMYPQPDGDVLEKGNMQNPATGMSCDYEEVWRDLDIHVLEGEQDRVCIVLKADSPSTGVKGIVMRIGEWCQGILKTSNGLTVERWQWLDIAKPKSEQATRYDHDFTPHNEWTKLARFGSGSLPSPSALSPVSLTKEATVALDGIEWKAVEICQW